MCDVERRGRVKIPHPFLWIYFSLLLSIPISNLGDAGAGGSPFVVQVEDNLLTLRLKDAPLEKVLTEIAHQAGIQITFYGRMEGALSADFSDLPMEKGLRRLIRDFNYVFIYGAEKGRRGDPAIKELIIYSKEGKGPHKRIAPRVIAPQEQSSHGLKQASLEALVKALEDKDPEVREDAVDILAEVKDERAIAHLTKVLLNDKDEDVRESAAEALGDLRDKRAIGPLVEALRDRDAGVRESAVDALGVIGGDEVISPLMDALTDEDEDVREAAADALKELTGRDFSH